MSKDHQEAEDIGRLMCGSHFSLSAAVSAVAVSGLAIPALHELQGGAAETAPGQKQGGVRNAAGQSRESIAGHQFQGHEVPGRLGSETLLARHNTMAAPHAGHEWDVFFKPPGHFPRPCTGMHHELPNLLFLTIVFVHHAAMQSLVPHPVNGMCPMCLS